jgi:hypothetical protein
MAAPTCVHVMLLLLLPNLLPNEQATYLATTILLGIIQATT